MRKIISLLLALSLLMCMGVSAVAAEDTNAQSDAVSESIEKVETSAVSEEPEVVPESETVPESEESDPESGTVPESEESESDPESETVSEPNVPNESDTSEQLEQPDESAVPKDTDVTENSEVTKESEQPEGDTTPSESDGADTQVIKDTPVGDVPISDGIMPVSDNYNVTISWTGMVFTYTEASKGTWDPSPDVFDYKDKGQKGTWQSSDGKGYGTFTVKINHEMTETIRAKFQFDRNTDEEGGFEPAVRMKFSKSTSMSSATFNTGELYFYSSDSSKTQSLYAVPTILSVSADDFGGEGQQKKLGTVTISIEVVDDSEWQIPPTPEQPGIE